jgi:hypothetical protein
MSMGDQMQTTNVDLRDLEIELCRLPDVVATRIVENDHGEPIEIHVLAHTGKAPKQVARDIQSVALTSFGLDLDRRIISVVQLSANGDGMGTTAEPHQAVVTPRGSSLRPQLAAVESRTSSLHTSVRITLTQGDEEAIGTAEGSAAASARMRLVAVATLDALQQLEVSAQSLDVDAATSTRVGSEEVATVTLVSIEPPYEQRLVGSAIVLRQLDDAVARAVLDATNRRLGQLAGEASRS